jgi:hypothetical protein
MFGGRTRTRIAYSVDGIMTIPSYSSAVQSFFDSNDMKGAADKSRLNLTFERLIYSFPTFDFCVDSSNRNGPNPRPEIRRAWPPKVYLDQECRGLPSRAR